MGKISAVVNTYNAEKHLEKVLKSLEGFDEIVVCDMARPCSEKRAGRWIG